MSHRRKLLENCGEGKWETVKNQLLNQQQYIKAKDEKGNNCLHYAAFGCQKEVITNLLTQKAPVNSQNEEGRTAALISAETGDLEILKVLAKYGADLNIPAYNGYTVLHCSSWKNRKKVVEYILINNVTNVNVPTLEGVTPLFIACEQGHLEIVKMLMSYGANVNLCNNKQASPLHIAVHRNHVDIVKYLVKNNADVNLQIDNGKTSLHLAIEDNFDEIAICLIDKGAKGDLQDKSENNTPLHDAVRKNNAYVAQYLLFNEPEMVKNRKGETPIDIAKTNKNDELVSILEQYFTGRKGTQPLNQTVATTATRQTSCDRTTQTQTSIEEKGTSNIEMSHYQNRTQLKCYLKYNDELINKRIETSLISSYQKLEKSIPPNTPKDFTTDEEPDFNLTIRQMKYIVPTFTQSSEILNVETKRTYVTYPGTHNEAHNCESIPRTNNPSDFASDMLLSLSDIDVNFVERTKKSLDENEQELRQLVQQMKYNCTYTSDSVSTIYLEHKLPTHASTRFKLSPRNAFDAENTNAKCVDTFDTENTNVKYVTNQEAFQLDVQNEQQHVEESIHLNGIHIKKSTDTTVKTVTKQDLRESKEEIIVPVLPQNHPTTHEEVCLSLQRLELKQMQTEHNIDQEMIARIDPERHKRTQHFDTPSDLKLYEIASQLGSSWIELGIRLGFSNPHLEYMQMDYTGRMLHGAWNMLIRWRNQTENSHLNILKDKLTDINRRDLLRYVINCDNQ